MKTTKRLQIMTGLGVALALSACDSGNSGNSANQNQQAQVAPSPASIAQTVDSKLKKYYPGNSSMDSVMQNLYSLKEICAEKGGNYNSDALECPCPNGGLFTTAADEPGCAAVTTDGSGFSLVDRSGSYQTKSDYSKLALVTLLGPSEDQTVATWKENAVNAPKPFRLSFLGQEDFRIADTLFPDSEFSTHTALMSLSGEPFSADGASLGLYEPDPKFALAALDQDPEPMSDSDRRLFSSITLPDSFDIELTTFGGDMDAAPVVKQAYDRLPRVFSPTSISSPFESGCATYCVASERISTDADSNYIATYRKVYQFGTPSSRMIVVQDAKNLDVVGVVALNVAGTVSTVNFIHIDRTPPFGYPYTISSTYDRYGNHLWTDRDSNTVDSFKTLLR
jgi:hypothetical protein